MKIQLNGEEHELERGASVSELLSLLDFASNQVAVERNRVLVPRVEHAQTKLDEGDEVEVVTLVGGG